MRVAENCFKIMKYSSRGFHPSNIFKTLWQNAKDDKYNPARHHTFYDVDNPPAFYLKYNRYKRFFDKFNKEKQEAIHKKKAFNAGVSAVLREPLLKVLPQLLNIEADWWIFYRYIMFSECMMWEQQQQISYYIEYGMGEEWLSKTHKERRNFGAGWKKYPLPKKNYAMH